MERLTLPHAAHALWTRVEQPLNLALRHLRTAGVQWTLGGGTVMAARWRHRRSNDIDLTVPQGSGIHALSDEASGFTAQMMAAGARRTALGTRHHVIEFSGTTGSLEITEMDLRPAGGATLMRCGASEVFVCTNTQIIRGKLERSLRHEAPARDLYDTAVAARLDPQSLAQAVNMLPPEAVREIANEWRQNEHRLRHEAVNALEDVDPEHQRLLSDLVGVASQAILDARYTVIEISRGQQAIAIRAATSGGSRHTLRATSETLRETLEASGLDEYLRSGNVGVGGKREQIDDLAAGRIPGPIVVSSI